MILTALTRAIELARAMKRKAGDARWRRRLASSASTHFTHEYGRDFTSSWARTLGGLRGREGVTMLEIGSLEGWSAIWFLENVLTHKTARLVCVDPFLEPGLEPRFDHNLRVSGHAAKVVKKKGTAETIVPMLEPASFDAVYVDGSHRARDVLMDALASWRALKPGGILIFDDYLWEPKLPPPSRPQLAIDLFLESAPSDLEVLQKGYQVIVRKRPR